MDKLVSSWCSDKTLPESYIFPPDTRPGNLADAPVSASVPTIDLSGDRPDTIHKIIEASRDFGFFQVTNHGIDGKLVAESGDVLKEVFQMTAEDKAALNTFSGDKKRSPSSSSSFKLYTSTTNYDKEQLHFWRDNFKHPCFPNLQHCIKSWPEKPSRYREIIKEYCVEAKKLGSRILELISEGLGLGNEYFNGSLSEVAHLSVNHYPPCPDPSLTLGLARHCDPGLITILHQDVYGLQVFKDGEWIGVDPLPHAFVINIGYQLQVICNKKLTSAMHRVVTNPRVPRTTAVFFINPSDDCMIEPAKKIVEDTCNHPVYSRFQFTDFMLNFGSVAGDPEATLIPYELPPPPSISSRPTFQSLSLPDLHSTTFSNMD